MELLIENTFLRTMRTIAFLWEICISLINSHELILDIMGKPA